MEPVLVLEFLTVQESVWLDRQSLIWDIYNRYKILCLDVVVSAWSLVCIIILWQIRNPQQVMQTDSGRSPNPHGRSLSWLFEIAPFSFPHFPPFWPEGDRSWSDVT